ncbi:hypothetical protein HDV00_010470 [Rhizophlyctis rosea]|nr:hypothetical protein HDV00_010470 [Rhizophlyctis rosea]
MKAIRRIPNRNLSLSSTYRYPPTAGANVTVYVLDSGINAFSSEFDDRVTKGPNYVEQETDEDLRGHGTFVASLVGGKTFGVAKRVNLVSVKVFNRDGTGTTSDLIRGIQYVVETFNQTKENSIINISGTQAFSRLVNMVVNGAVSFGIPVTVAAGNEASDACEYSPPSAALALTIGATTETDQVASFSNTGPCIDFFAPGENVTALWGNGTVQTKSGTSFSAPIAAGALALFWGENLDLNSKMVQDELGRNLTVGVVKGIGFFDKAPNLFVWTTPPGCEDCSDEQQPRNQLHSRNPITCDPNYRRRRGSV